jgi:HK97 gp10 family phage protein
VTSVGSADINRIAEALRETGRQSYATTHEVLVQSANFLLTEMEARVPVGKTGALKRSLGVRVEGDRVIVGPLDNPYAAYVEFGTAPHEIRPKNPDGVLRFQINGRWVFAKVVHHPGTKPEPFVRPAFEAYVKMLGPEVAQANVNVFENEANHA